MNIRIQPDKQKAIALNKTAIITLERLNKIKKEEYPSNTLTDYYDIIRRLMEALNYIDGIKIKGDGAHINIINYICDKYCLSQFTREFIQNMREYRNRISYEGFSVNEDYIKKNSKKIENIINQLFNILNKKI